MRRYGNVAGFIYRAQQQAAPPKPGLEPEQEDENFKRFKRSLEHTKWCSNCEKELPLGCFRRNRALPDGLSRYCKLCEDRNEQYRRERAKRLEEGSE